MRKLAIITILIVFFFSSVANAKERKGIFTMNFSIKSGKGHYTRLWIPYPMSDEFQRISDVKITGNYDNYAVYRSAEANAVYIYAEWKNPSQVPTLTFQFRAEAKERTVKELKEEGNIPVEVRKYLMAERFIPTDGKIKEIADGIVKGKKGILEKARAVYDWVVENTYRDPRVKGCGRGIVEETLAKRGGKCADISTVFVALARAAGVPARDVFGLRLAKVAEKDMTGGYHCWAEFYLPGTGWVPVDPADVRKIMLIKKLSLEDVKPYREYYFGKVDQYRIVLERSGRGIVLDPPQEDSINYFMYPYAEVDGKKLDYLDPENFSYSIKFKAF
ncbi:MAG: transglutaminase domain-containing protein [Nitrospirae bacterium]|nr:transglutaminase domain-containing protein [Nitrospirota bacterium]